VTSVNEINERYDVGGKRREITLKRRRILDALP
jgi:hypothetical protein